MKKVVLTLAGLGVIAGMSIATINYNKTRHPTVTQVSDGCIFVYDLNMPTLPVGSTRRITAKLHVPFGDKAEGMPYVDRPKPITNCKEARAEAEARADLIENIHHKESTMSELGLDAK